MRVINLLSDDVETHFRVEVTEDERLLTDEEFFEFCQRNPDLRIERRAGGEIVIVPPSGFETGYRNNDVSRQLGNWAEADGRGVAVDSNTAYLLADGAVLAPDASWVLKSRLAKLNKDQLKRFLPLCPDFVVELISPTDRIPRVKAKMQEWIENGAQLGWLIDADQRTIYVYRPELEPEELVNVDAVAGEGPVQGFTLELGDIWRGL